MTLAPTKLLRSFCKSVQNDIVLIRHAESQFNAACHSYANQLGIDKLGWNEQMQVKAFTQSVTFNDAFIDSRITSKGKQQCRNTKSLMKNIPIDLILVSPKVRTLETCSLIFGKKPEAPVLVKPILAEVCRFSCDAVDKTPLKLKEFPHYDFSQLIAEGEDIYVHNVSQSKLNQMRDHYQRQDIQGQQDKRKQLMKLMEQKIIYETNQELRERVWNIKQMLLSYKSQYNRIAIISHWYVLTYLRSKGFGEDGQNIDYDDVDNCTPYFASLENLMKVH